jgi:hypothetical protein
MSKKSFKIFLDSNNTSSWAGLLYRANYYVDLKNIIQDSNDYYKSYYMYCSFVSIADDVTVNSITPAKVYTLHIDMNKGINVYQFKNTKTPSFLLPVQVNPSVLGVADPDTRFFLQDEDQRPTFIPNILNINSIQIQVIDTSTDSITASNAPYVCVLTFVEC